MSSMIAANWFYQRKSRIAKTKEDIFTILSVAGLIPFRRVLKSILHILKDAIEQMPRFGTIVAPQEILVNAVNQFLKSTSFIVSPSFSFTMLTSIKVNWNRYFFEKTEKLSVTNFTCDDDQAFLLFIFCDGFESLLDENLLFVQSHFHQEIAERVAAAIVVLWLTWSSWCFVDNVGRRSLEMWLWKLN
jgi:hypothetical protein